VAAGQAGVINCGMRGRVALLVLGLLALGGGQAAAQAPALSDNAKAMIGTWEFSNADRDRVCSITFRGDPSGSGMKVEFDRACVGQFPFIRDVAAWTLLENDFLRLLDSAGRSVLDFSEVESGVYEAPRPGEGILFIQNAAAAAPAAPQRSAAEITGEWTVMRGAGKPVCGLTLSNTAAGPDFAVRVRPPCDPVVARFGPATWQVDRSEIVLKSARGQTWRFEQGEDQTWRRIPETADPILLVRK
jgi:hypothetical protein